MQYFVDHPYLTLSLLGLVLVLAIMYRLPRRRRGILIGGLLGAPFGMLSFEFVPDYWDPAFAFPVHFGGSFAFSLDDLLFSFVTGALAWFFATGASNGALELRADARRILLRFLALGVPGVTLARLLKITVLPELPMIATMISIAVMTGVYIRLKPWALAPAAGACWRFVAAYAVFIAAMIALFPGSLAYWDTPHHPSFSLLGLPLWELAWAAAYGLVFPLFQLAVVDAEPVPAPRPAVATQPVERRRSEA
jgi:hypothetical protein